MESEDALSELMLSGLINAILYSVILAAALDLVGPGIPKGVVLLVDVAPCFLAKLLALPLNFHNVPYKVRVIGFAALSLTGMLLISLSDSVPKGGYLSIKLVGIGLASISSGGGDLSFLGLTHYYGQISLAAWSSGTGAAGFIGASVYATMTTWMGFGVRKSLLFFSLLPIVMLVSFFFVLPKDQMKMSEQYPAPTACQVPNTGQACRATDIEDESETLLTTSENESLNSSIESRIPARDGPLASLMRCRSIFLPL